MALGGIIQRIIDEVCAYYSDDAELSFFEYVFNDANCETSQNEEELQKKMSSDFICKIASSALSFNTIEMKQKKYILLSSLFISGFYFSLIQPPD
jgi:hypothetical protein